jgi:photosystem II stability/assembly factor-like uncharacterized protein
LSSEPYSWRNVVIGGGGFVTGIISHPRQKGLMYARTDVGGAYRWDASAQRWIPLTDGIGDVDFTGIESLAVDPSDPNRVYLAAGIYSRGKAAILRSADQGRTWLHTDVPFKMGGNEAGRFNGERLAVDPNDGAILFFGSRRGGLWKSTDRGATWQKVDGFPDVASHEASLADDADARPWFGFNQQPVGIVCVLFDPTGSRPGQPTPTLYAAVSTTETNLYRSTDGGVTWLAVADQPVSLRPNHLVRASDGMLYLSYGKEPGPNTMTDGAVWKFNAPKGIWTDITPLKPAKADQPFGYGAVAVDAQHPSTIMAATFAHWNPCDEIFRSTNGGANWTPLLPQARWDHASAPYTQNLKPHWMGDLEINPFNSDQVLFVTGYGIWSSRNMTDADAGRPTRWTFLDNGLEETVPLALLSPSEGAHLLSGVGDIDGFRHDDLNNSPAPGAFDGPRYSNTEDMAVAGKNLQVIVRTGTGRSGAVRAAISADGGKTWSALGREPTNSAGAGTIAISADGKTIVWTPRRSIPSYSNDRGRQWTACAGITPLICSTASFWPAPMGRPVLPLPRRRSPKRKGSPADSASAAPATPRCSRPRVSKAIYGWPSTTTVSTTAPTAVRALPGRTACRRLIPWASARRPRAGIFPRCICPAKSNKPRGSFAPMTPGPPGCASTTTSTNSAPSAMSPATPAFTAAFISPPAAAASSTGTRTRSRNNFDNDP